MLKQFVASYSNIELVGYQIGSMPAHLMPGVPITLVTLGKSTDGPVFLRAQSVTSHLRYQMDRANTKLGQEVAWQSDVLAQLSEASAAQPALDLSKLAILACSNNCSGSPNTIYWPVLFKGTRSDGGLMLALRAGVRADQVSIRFQTSALETVDATYPDVVLVPDGVTFVTLPRRLTAGRYQVVVTATDIAMQEQLKAFVANIVIPSERP
ncbi:hypothetical protein [Caballeronia arationis]|uniref:hypothetical protein n=1 Tax=Caballeronia arationis TaxID=1777142 RepID=UPI0011982181|nr:hypothetical protein [Caballeronia arationis]